MRLQGTMPLPLTETDKKSLSDIAATLQEEDADVLYSSGNESSGPSASCLAEICGLKTRKEPLLKELNCGLWQGLQVRDIKNRYGRAYKQWRNDPLSVCPPQGECVSEALTRVRQAVVKLIKKNRNKSVVIVAAPIVAAIIECLLTSNSMEHFWRYADQGRVVKVFPDPEIITDNNDILLTTTAPKEIKI